MQELTEGSTEAQTAQRYLSSGLPKFSRLPVDVHNLQTVRSPGDRQIRQRALQLGNSRVGHLGVDEPKLFKTGQSSQVHEPRIRHGCAIKEKYLELFHSVYLSQPCISHRCPGEQEVSE